MASLPPLRARAVTNILSDCDGIDDAVHRISQEPKEARGGCDGSKRLLEYAKGVAFPWHAVRVMQSELQRHCVVEVFKSFLRTCPPWPDLPSGRGSPDRKGAPAGLPVLQVRAPLNLRSSAWIRVRAPYLGQILNQFDWIDYRLLR